MIRVLHITSGMIYGGIETFIMEVYRNIDREMVQFDFLVHTKEKCAFDDEIKQLGGIIHHVTSRHDNLAKNVCDLNSFFRHNKEYSIIHQHISSLSYVTPLKFARLYGYPVRIAHSHSTADTGGPFHLWLHEKNKKRIDRIATHYFACSDLAADWLFPKHIQNGGKMKLIRNGIDLKKFRFSQTIRDKYREEMMLTGKLVVGHIGRFHSLKNHKMLLEIFYHIHRIEPNAVLLLIGDGNLKTDILNKIEELGICDSVIMTGVRSDIAELMQAMDVYVLPSLSEGLPISLVEAQATGLPCFVSSTITQDVSITPNIFYIELSQPAEHWANRIVKEIQSKERVDMSDMVQNAGFSIEDTADILQQFYLGVTVI